ncbi:MAG TPA: hypothetical protein VFC03_20160 [Acidimicrobiales bacterium]|nr:hypothetical protein [Acidimicrobiales bacterium]
MIGKITTGASGRSLIRYLFGPGKANEHTDQRVITSGLALGGDVLAGRALSRQAIVELGSDLDAANDLSRADPAGGHIWHLSLSLPAGDRPLTDDQWAEVARKTTKAIGFEREGLEPAAWVAVAHGASAQGNQHIHIAASLVRLDGSRVETWQSKRTISRVCAEVEHTYGLNVVEGREGRGMPGLTRAELERTAREQLAEPPRITLARIVREASVASETEAEFVRRLRGSGALVRPRFETGGKEAVIGYSVAVRPGVGDTPIWFGGGKLARDLTLPSLRQFWELSPSDRRVAVAEWTVTRSVPGREAVKGMPGDWERAVSMVSDAAELLGTVSVSDIAAWRGAALETAGVFAVLSRRIEGDTPGPLAATADVLARSAQSRPGEPMASRTPGRGLRGVAAVVAQSELSNESPVAWMMLLDQLGRTLRAISAAHVARGETEMAIALVDHLEGELVALQDQFGRSRDERLVPDIQRVWAYDGSQKIEALDCGVGLDTDLDLDLDGEFDFER